MFLTKTNKFVEKTIDVHLVPIAEDSNTVRPDSVRDIVFFRDQIISAGGDGNVFFSTIDNVVLRVFSGHESGVERLVEHRESSLAVSGGKKGCAKSTFITLRLEIKSVYI